MTTHLEFLERRDTLSGFESRAREDPSREILVAAIQFDQDPAKILVRLEEIH